MTSQPNSQTPLKPPPIPSKFHFYHLQKLPPSKASQFSLIKNLFSPKTHHFHFNDCQSLSIKKSKNLALKTAKLHLSSYLFSPESETSHFLINPHAFRYLRRIHSLEIIICDHSPDQKLDKGLTCNGCLDTFTLLTSITRHNPFQATSLRMSAGQDLFKDMRKLKCLKKLYLNFTSVSRVDIQRISQAIISSKVLAKISLVLRLPLMTNIQTNSFSSLLPKFHRLTHFELDLTNNTASSKTLNALLLNLKGLTRLNELHFTFRKASMIPVDLHSFKEAVKNMKNLQALYLNFTSIELIRGSTEDLGEGLRSLKKLKALRLNLVKCQFQHESVVNLGRLLGKMDFLRVLEINLVSSNLESRLLTGFMGSLKMLERLKEFSLKISNNKLDDYVLGKIVEVLKGYKRVKRVELAGDSCGFSDKGMRNLVDLKEGMSELKELKLSFSVNRLIKDEGVKMLMDGILEGRRLERLKVDFRICGVSKEFKDCYVEKVKGEFPSIEDSVLFTSSSG